MLPDPRNTVVLVGYQADGTRGRDLAEGAAPAEDARPVRPGAGRGRRRSQAFSVHADADELLAWLARAPEPPETVYVVHGEAARGARLAARVHEELGWVAVVPHPGERVRLD